MVVQDLVRLGQLLLVGAVGFVLFRVLGIIDEPLGDAADEVAEAGRTVAETRPPTGYTPPTGEAPTLSDLDDDAGPGETVEAGVQTAASGELGLVSWASRAIARAEGDSPGGETGESDPAFSVTSDNLPTDVVDTFTGGSAQSDTDGAGEAPGFERGG